MNSWSDLARAFVDAFDFAPATRRAILADLNKFEEWFVRINGEVLTAERVTIRDVVDYRDGLLRHARQAARTINRSLVSLRRFLDHLVRQGLIASNPAAGVRQLRLTPSRPGGVEQADLRRVLRETELRGDRRAAAALGLMAYAGLRVSEVASLELHDITIGPRSGQVLVRHGKGNKQRTVPLPSHLRQLIADYVSVRVGGDHGRLLVGERGPLTTDGIRTICSKYAAMTGVRFTPHSLRHTFARQYLRQSQNDLVGLAQILGHESLDTTAIYTRRANHELAVGMEAGW